MINAIQIKALELVNRIGNIFDPERLQALRDEKGQTATEYVAMTAVGLILAITIVYLFLSEALTTAIQTIGNKLVNFVGT